MTTEQAEELCKWITEKSSKISECDVTWRLNNHPSILVDHQSQSVRSYLRALNEDMELPAQKMHINPKHEVIRGLYHLREQEHVAEVLTTQIVDNA